jgi:hypothetical protein
MMGAQTQPVSDVLITWLTATPVTVLAFLVVAFLRGWVVPAATHQRRLAELNAQAAEIRRLHTVYEDQVIPMMTRAIDLLGRTAEWERTR